MRRPCPGPLPLDPTLDPYPWTRENKDVLRETNQRIVTGDFRTADCNAQGDVCRTRRRPNGRVIVTRDNHKPGQ